MDTTIRGPDDTAVELGSMRPIDIPQKPLTTRKFSRTSPITQDVAFGNFPATLPSPAASPEPTHPLHKAWRYSGSKISALDMLAPYGKRKRACGGALVVLAFVVIASYTLAKIIYLFTDPQLKVSSAVLETGNQPLPMCLGCRVLLADEPHASCTVTTADGISHPMKRLVLPGDTVVVNQSISSQWVNYHACTIVTGRQALDTLIFIALYVQTNWTFLRQPEMVLVPQISATVSNVNPVFSELGYTRVSVLMTELYGMRSSAEIGRYNTLDLTKQSTNFATDFFNSIQITNPIDALSLSNVPITTLWLSIPPYVIGPAQCAYGGDFNLKTAIDPPAGFDTPFSACGGLELTLVGHRIITQIQAAESRMSVIGGIFGFAAGTILICRIIYHVYCFQRLPHCVYCMLLCPMCLSFSGAVAEEDQIRERRDNLRPRGDGSDSPPAHSCDSQVNLLRAGSSRELGRTSMTDSLDPTLVDTVDPSVPAPDLHVPSELDGLGVLPPISPIRLSNGHAITVGDMDRPPPRPPVVSMHTRRGSATSEFSDVHVMNRGAIASNATHPSEISLFTESAMEESTMGTSTTPPRPLSEAGIHSPSLTG